MQVIQCSSRRYCRRAARRQCKLRLASSNVHSRECLPSDKADVLAVQEGDHWSKPFGVHNLGGGAITPRQPDEGAHGGLLDGQVLGRVQDRDEGGDHARRPHLRQLLRPQRRRDDVAEGVCRKELSARSTVIQQFDLQGDLSILR